MLKRKKNVRYNYPRIWGLLMICVKYVHIGIKIVYLFTLNV